MVVELLEVLLGESLQPTRRNHLSVLNSLGSKDRVEGENSSGCVIPIGGMYTEMLDRAEK